MAGSKGVRKAHVKLPSKTTNLDSAEIAGPDRVTKALAEGGGKLVTSAVLQPDVPEIVMASQEQLDREYADMLKFNEEPVTIVILSDGTEFPVDPVMLGCNGKQIYCYRDKEYTMPRKFVESLCNPVARIKTKQTKNNLGEDATEIEQTRSFLYPFRVVKDDNPKSKLWLQSLLRR